MTTTTGPNTPPAPPHALPPEEPDETQPDAGEPEPETETEEQPESDAATPIRPRRARRRTVDEKLGALYEQKLRDYDRLEQREAALLAELSSVTSTRQRTASELERIRLVLGVTDEQAAQ